MAGTYALLLVPSLFFTIFVAPTLSGLSDALVFLLMLATLGSFTVVRAAPRSFREGGSCVWGLVCACVCGGGVVVPRSCFVCGEGGAHRALRAWAPGDATRARPAQVSMKDPGVVPRKGATEDEENQLRPGAKSEAAAVASAAPGSHYCVHCRISVPADVAHCDDCDVCIAGCVGKRAGWAVVRHVADPHWPPGLGLGGQY